MAEWPMNVIVRDRHMVAVNAGSGLGDTLRAVLAVER